LFHFCFASFSKEEKIREKKFFPKMILTVYTDTEPNQKQANIIRLLAEKNFMPYVDGLNGENFEYLKNHSNTNTRFFFCSEFVSMVDIEQLFLKPDISILFTDKTPDENSWICISRYLEHLIYPQNKLDKKVLDIAELYFEPIENTIIESIPETLPKYDDFYKVNYKLFERLDTMLIQVDKPFCDLPYTCVIRNFKTRGFIPFFTDIYIYPSWGISKNDTVFLSNIWLEWKIEGDFNLSKLMKDSSKDILTQPEVYRLDLDTVCQELLTLKPVGVRKDPWNKSRLNTRNEENLKLSQAFSIEPDLDLKRKLENDDDDDDDMGIKKQKIC
jgi:hypothetical protein